MKQKFFSKKLNRKPDKGSALVSVLVIVAFISILATIVLYLAATNYKMKIADSRTKESFYEAEEVVELFKANLTLDVAEAARRAYGRCNSEYVFLSSKENRREHFLIAFNNELQNVWEEHWNETTPGAGDGFNHGISEIFRGASVSDIAYVPVTGICNFKVTTGGRTYYCTFNEYSLGVGTGFDFTYESALEIPADADVFRADNTVNPSFLRNLNITVTDGKDYTSKIVTSFIITPPEFNWGDEVFKDDDLNEITDIYYSDCVVYTGWSKE